jgi:hypothetical protein
MVKVGPEPADHDTMRFLDRLNLGQRIVLVIALGVFVYILGFWLSVVNKHLLTGWVAYSPLTNPTTGEPGGLTVGQSVLVWTGLAIVWLILSLVVLRTPQKSPVALSETDADDAP